MPTSAGTWIVTDGDLSKSADKSRWFYDITPRSTRIGVEDPAGISVLSWTEVKTPHFPEDSGDTRDEGLVYMLIGGRNRPEIGTIVTR